MQASNHFRNLVGLVGAVGAGMSMFCIGVSSAAASRDGPPRRGPFGKRMNGGRVREDGVRGEGGLLMMDGW